MLKYLNVDRKHYLVLRLSEVLKKLDSITMVVNVWLYSLSFCHLLRISRIKSNNRYLVH